MHSCLSKYHPLILMCFCQVNSFGNVVYDEYVRTVERIVDYRTRISGIRPKHMNKGRYVNIVNL
jgi:hypothetical protein